MKVLLWDPTTKLYLQAEDAWTAERELALEFTHSADACSFAMRKRLQQVQVLLAFESREFDISVPILSLREPPPQSPAPGRSR